MTLNCLLLLAFPFIVLFTFPMMSWSCPFHSSQLPLHVPVIFSVCPLHFPCMSRSFVASHCPTSPVVPIGFLVLCSLLFPPALPLFSFLFFLSCSFQFPFCHVDFLFPPLIFVHFLVFPLCSPVFPAKTRVLIFGKRRQETQTSKEPAGGFEPGTPVLRERHQITARYPTYQTSGGVGLGGVILYPLLGVQHASAMSADILSL